MFDASCGTFEKQSIRAEISIGENNNPIIIVSTPDVVSFNVNKRRGQMSATFSASIKVPYTFLVKGITAERVIIRAGIANALDTVFTGAIYQCVVNPIRTDASKIMLNINGSDVLYRLEGQLVNRRVTTWRDGDSPPERWGIVNNIVKEHTPLAKRFPTKLYTPTNVAVYDLKNDHLITTPDPFATKKNIDRSGDRKVYGGIIAERVPAEGNE